MLLLRLLCTLVGHCYPIIFPLCPAMAVAVAFSGFE